MKFSQTLLTGKLIKRYKRFFADIDYQGQIITAHVPNTGSMKSCSDPGSLCMFSQHDNPNRKLKYTLEMVQASNGAWVGVNTSHPNPLIKEAFQLKSLGLWKNFDQIQPEVKINAETRLDFLFSNQTKKRYVEVKNVSLAHEKTAMFPDAVTERGQKHLRELMKLVEQGHEAEIVFVIQRNDCKNFYPAEMIDPEYTQLLFEAQKKGVLITPLVCELNANEITVSCLLNVCR